MPVLVSPTLPQGDSVWPPWQAGRLAFFDPGAILGDAILFAKRGKRSDDKARAAVARSGPA